MKQEHDAFVGNMVTVEIYCLVSGCSSVPTAAHYTDVIGDMVAIDDTTYAIVDGETEVVRIFGVYNIEQDRRFGKDVLFVDGWINSGIWGRWIVEA